MQDACKGQEGNEAAGAAAESRAQAAHSRRGALQLLVRQCVPYGASRQAHDPGPHQDRRPPGLREEPPGGHPAERGLRAHVEATLVGVASTPDVVPASLH